MVCRILARNVYAERLIADRDYRLPKQPVVQYVESHNDDVTEVRTPAQTNSLGLDGIEISSFNSIRATPLGSCQAVPTDWSTSSTPQLQMRTKHLSKSRIMDLPYTVVDFSPGPNCMRSATMKPSPSISLSRPVTQRPRSLRKHLETLGFFH